ncbi:amidohydrolase [Gemmatimonadota bacterium]
MTLIHSAGCSDSASADLVLIPERIFTASSSEPWVDALAIRDGIIICAGTEEEVSDLIDDHTEVVRLPRMLAVPGFNDAHVHMFEGGEGLSSVQLRDARDENDFRDRIAAYCGDLPEGTWVLYGNWDHESWPSRAHPERRLIDPVTPSHPVFITRLDGHMSLANSLALQLAGVTDETPDPEGGEIERDPVTGDVTGILIDAAQDLIHAVIPEADEIRIRRALEAALTNAREQGVTSIQDNTTPRIWRIYQELFRDGALSSRVNAWYPISYRNTLASEGITGPSGDDWIRRGTMKIFVDGAMGSGSAWFHDPYSDDPSTSGLAMESEEELHRKIVEADALGFDIACHAIGDRANSVALDAFEEALEVNTGRDTPRRHRIEHAQIVREEDMERFRSLGITASIQPSHIIDDMRWAEERIGHDRCAIGYRIGSFLHNSIPVAFGTDWFVEPLDPRLGLYAAVTREFTGGGPEGGWFPAERITLEDAITAYTLGSARAEGMEDRKGMLVEGYLADITVFEEDLFSLEPRQWLETKVALTIVGGRIVFSR